jgi:hypothetical protein
MKPLSSTSRGVLIAACALFVAVVVVFAARQGSVQALWARSHSGGDFVAFYCAGKIAVAGEDPYRTEPLRTCEQALEPLARASAADVTPAPFPGYSLAFFGLLARLPYGAAMALWYLVLIAALAVATISLSRMLALPWYVVLAALAVPFAYANFVFAQIPPVAVAALCVAAYLVQQRRFAAAGVVAGISMIEPHIGLPACIALFVFAPACRIAVAATAAALAVVSLATLGVATNIEYLTRALPLHALAEAGTSDQLSFTWLLHWFGVGDRAAVAAGSISYVVMTLIGLWLARLCARAFAADHLIVLVPPAVAMLGGAFVHELQYAAVMPAALALAVAIGSAPAWTAVAILAMPWQGAWTSRLYLALAVVAMSVIVWYAAARLALAPRLALAAGAVIAFVLLTFGIGHLSAAPVHDAGSPTAFYDALGADQALASAEWGVVMRSDPHWSSASLQTLAQKIPPWSGIMLMMAAAGLALARRRSAEPATAGEASARPRIAPAMLILVAVNLCITLTLSAVLNIDTDESYTMHTTAGTTHDAYTRALSFEFQPPLYFVVMQLWRQIDPSVFFGRLFSALCIAATVVIAAAISRRVSPGMNAGWLAAIVALNPFAIWAAVEMRVYAFVIVLTALLLLAFLDGFLAEERSLRAQIGFVLVAVAGLYTHYYIGFLLVGFGAALLALRRWRALAAYAAAGGLVAIAFLPLASSVAHQALASHAEVTGNPSFAYNFLLITKLLALVAIPVRWAQPHDLWILVAAALAFFAVITARAALRAWPLRVPTPLVAMACALAVAGITFAVALSVTEQPLANRYVAFLFMPLMASVCAAFAAFGGFTRRHLAGTWLGIMFGASIITLVLEYGPLAKTGDWQRVAAYVMRTEQPGQPILVFQAEAAEPLRYYYHGTNQLVPVPRPLNLQTYDLHELALTGERDVDEALARAPGDHRRIWVVTTDYCSTGSLDYNCPLFESYLAKHYTVVRELSFYRSTLRELEHRVSADALHEPHGLIESIRPSGPRVGATN